MCFGFTALFPKGFYRCSFASPVSLPYPVNGRKKPQQGIKNSRKKVNADLA